MARFLTFLRDSWRARVHTIHEPVEPSKRIALFYRDFRGFTGGHLKVWHYFNHAQHSVHYQPRIAFSADAVWNDTNPWLPIRDQALATWDPERADILFLAGMDWSVLSEAQRRVPPKPVINLIQHVRHADPKELLYQYLTHRAVRICVSEPVAEALRATQRVNGPLFTIPNGMDPAELPPLKPWELRDLDLLIVGIKQPNLATEIYSPLKASAQRIEVLTHSLPRPAFLKLLGNARVTLLLPHATEGFYLPALEGFALGTLVICPDCIGNRSFCLPGENCLQPPSYTVESLLQSVQQAWRLLPHERLALLEAARHMARQHSLLEERRSFLELLEQIGTIW